MSFAACLAGAAVPLTGLGLSLAGMFAADASRAVVAVGVAAVAVAPPAVVAETAWLVRRDRRASRVVAVVAVVNLAIGAVGWGWAASDPEGGAACVAHLFVPWAQFLAWFCGALWSGLRRVR
ncbi:MAG: hypothetical protein C0501_26845 [Isosphaera sp.]|nr:hypothetical protein [Isosphaera sp.]